MGIERLNNKLSIGFFPTPLHKLKNISSKFPDYEVFIKRDDQTGLASGGNKTRKLEYLLWDAIDKKCDTIITAGAQQSNHCRQTAAACAMFGLECHLLLGGYEPSKYQGNLLLSEMLGAQIHFAGDERKGEGLVRMENELCELGKKCYVIPYGGSNLVGALGFVNAMKELKHQIMEFEHQFDYIFFASSSGGTQAGMYIGNELYEIGAELIPINIDKEDGGVNGLKEKVLKLLVEGNQQFKFSKAIKHDDIKVNSDYDQPGYGQLSNNEKKAIQELAATEGIVVDPVYTGRAFYGMLDVLRKGLIPKGSKVLFWHTGGFPAVFKYENELK